MAWYYWVLIIIGGFFVILAIIGMMLPKIAKMQRSIIIKAPAADIFGKLDNMREFVKWSPWSDKDPNMKQEFSGPENGIGSKYEWSGNKKVGSGSMEVNESTPNTMLMTELIFHGRGTSKAGYYLEESNGETKVTWIFEGDMGNNPAGRIMGTMMDKFLGPDYEKGLSNLKNMCE